MRLKKLNPKVAVIFEAARAFEGGHSVTPNSGCRCKEWNEVVQKNADFNYIHYSSNSKHMPDEDGYCSAIDYPTNNPEALYNFLDILFPNTFGFGLYSWGVHFDCRTERDRW